MSGLFRATIPQAAVFAFPTQASQYPTYGEPGIGYFRGEVDAGYVDCLLFRDPYGVVVGILNHYPMDLPPWEREGNVNVFIDPAHKRQGIGTALVAECIARWGRINVAQQRFTPEGVAFATRLVQVGALDGGHRRTGLGGCP